MKTTKHYVYTDITKETVFLLLIADIVRLSFYQMLLLYETFGNDTFVFFDVCSKKEHFKELTKFRVNRCMHLADSLTPVLLGEPKERMNLIEMKAYRTLSPLLYENKFRVEEDIHIA